MAKKDKKNKNRQKEDESFVCRENEKGEMVCDEKGDKNITASEGKIMPAQDNQGDVDIEDSEQRYNAPEIDTKKGNIFIGTLNMMSSPAKALAKPFGKHYREKYRDKYRHSKKLFILDMVLLGIVLLLALTNVYFFFGGTLGIFPISQKALLDIDHNPQVLVSGEDTEFIFNYINNSEDKLTEVNMTVDLPPYFEIIDYSPNTFNKSTNTFNLETLDPGANGKARIVGKFFGEVGKTGEVKAKLNYHVGNRQGRDITTLAYIPESSLFEAVLDAPETIVKNQLFSFNVRYYNNSSYKLDEFIISPEWPDGFQLKSSSSPTGENGDWHIKDFAPGAEGQINIEGVFTGSDETVLIKITPHIKYNNKIAQKISEASINIVNPHFSLHLSSLSEGAVNPGEELDYKINYQNNGSYNLRNVSFEFIKESPFSGGDENKIFDSKTNPELALIRPGDKGEMIFSIKTKSDSGSIKEGADSLIKSFIRANYILEDRVERNVSEQTQTQEQKINTDLDLRAFARYYTSGGEQLGRGPIPPEAGFTTKYWIFWYPENNINNATDVLVKGFLPPQAEFTGASLPLGAVEYNPSDHSISWSAGRINKSGGQSGKGLSFEVAITPEENQIGQIIDIVSDIKISGTDEFTGENITKNIGDITTNLIEDEYVSGSGRVGN